MAAAAEIDLSAARERATPAQALAAMSDACVRLGVESFDVYGDFDASPSSSWLRRFELEIAAELGMPDAVFMPSGVMAQSVALMIHSTLRSAMRMRPMDTFIAHNSSHLLLHEQMSHKFLLRLNALQIPPDFDALVQQPVTLAAIAPMLSPPAPTTFAVILELPHRELGGKLTPWEDLVAISAKARAAGIAMHMDGARLWEAGPGYGKPLPEICELFDSVYVSFYKGLGGMTGAALVGNAAFIKEARGWLRRFGGNLYTMMPYAVSAWDGFRTNKDDFTRRRDRLRAIVALLTDEFGSSGLLRFDPPVPCVSLVHVYVNSDPATARQACDAAAAVTGIRCFSRIRYGSFGATAQSYFEMNCGPANAAIADEVWVRGWREMLTQLQAAKAAVAGVDGSK